MINHAHIHKKTNILSSNLQRFTGKDLVILKEGQHTGYPNQYTELNTDDNTMLKND